MSVAYYFEKPKKLQFLNIFILITLVSLLSACGGGTASNPGNTSNNNSTSTTPVTAKRSIFISVVDQNNIPLENITLKINGTATDLEGNSVSQIKTNSQGELALSASSEGQDVLTLQVNQTGYLSSGIEIDLVNDDRQFNKTLKLLKLSSNSFPNGISQKSMNLTTDTNGKVSNQTSLNITTASNQITGSFSIPQNTQLKTANGDVVQGALSIQVVDFDAIYDSSLINFFPGGLKVKADHVPDNNATSFTDEQNISFQSGKFTSYQITDAQNNKIKTIDSGQFTFSARISKNTINPNTGNKVAAGDEIEVWSYDEDTGKWRFEENVLLTDIGDSQFLNAQHVSNHLSFRYWGYRNGKAHFISRISHNFLNAQDSPLYLEPKGEIFDYGRWFVFNDSIDQNQYANINVQYDISYFGQIVQSANLSCSQANCSLNHDLNGLLPETKLLTIRTEEFCAGKSKGAIQTHFTRAFYQKFNMLIHRGDVDGLIQVRVPTTTGSITQYNYSGRYKNLYVSTTVNPSDTEITNKFVLKDALCPEANNHTPVATFTDFSLLENQNTSIQLTATDQDNKALTYQLVAVPIHGQLILNSDGSASYTPTADYFGDDYFVYKVNDGLADSNYQRVNINVIEDPQPEISQFSASKSIITLGDSVELNSVFIHGTGVIDQSVGSVVSNTPISVTPTSTTSYQLTVTDSKAKSTSANVTVSVVAEPKITRFVASQGVIASGNSVNLTAEFVGGTATINNKPVTSGVPLAFTPGENTTYTLKAINTAGKEVTQSLTVNVNLNPINVTISPSGATTKDEGNGGDTQFIFTVSVFVENSATLDTAITLDYNTIDETATAGSDYTSKSGSITFDPGTTSVDIPILVTGDTQIESDETFKFSLSNLKLTQDTGNFHFSINPPATATIKNDDYPLMSIADAIITEADSNLVFTVSLSEQANGNVTVDYASSDLTAIASSDYNAISGTATINSGFTSTTINVPILNDNLTEPTETFKLNLSNASANVTLLDAVAIGSILNDDISTLNDTGLTKCSDDTNTNQNCPISLYPGQDAEYGNDANNPINSDGNVGFSFTKLDNAGNALADQSVSYTSTSWACVKDNTTGLIWEVKTTNSDRRDKGWTYGWYNSTGINDGGGPGINNSSGASCFDSSLCNTETYTNQINTQALCGRTNWRLPTLTELLGIMDFGQSSAPYIDKSWFPNTASPIPYWTSIPSAFDTTRAWFISFDPQVANYLKSTGYPVRLVSETP